jgi:anti-sigma factor ChrR (cupin superfamily)
MLRWIGRWHTLYIATHPQDSFPESVLAELAELLGAVRALTFPDGTKRRPITSTCTALGEEFKPCGGRLSALVRDRLDPRGSVIVCDADPGHLIPEHEWLGILKTKLKGRPA